MKRKMDLAERQGFGSVILSTLLLMLIKYFKEERDHFIMCVERRTEFDEAADLVVFPDSKTPVLICAGPNIFDYDKIFFASDNQVLCTASNIAEGLTLLFTSYFVFNYVYSPKLSCFLTFIQRCILEINPHCGSRCPDARTARLANNKVLQLSNKFSDFNQSVGDDENLNDI